MKLDDLCQVRETLREAHNHISGKIVVNPDLILSSIDDSLNKIMQAILEAKHQNGG
jgi:hypothetical protein